MKYRIHDSRLPSYVHSFPAFRTPSQAVANFIREYGPHDGSNEVSVGVFETPRGITLYAVGRRDWFCNCTLADALTPLRWWLDEWTEHLRATGYQGEYDVETSCAN